MCMEVRLPVPHNGRFLRHRPERSERCLNYGKLYQGQPALPKWEGVPEGPQRKNHVVRRERVRSPEEWARFHRFAIRQPFNGGVAFVFERNCVGDVQCRLTVERIYKQSSINQAANHTPMGIRGHGF